MASTPQPTKKVLRKPVLKRLNLSNRRQRIMVVFGALLILAGGLFAWNRYAIYQDNKRFHRADIAVQELYTQITSHLGQPAQTINDSSCAYASHKFSRGPLGCSTNYKFEYAVADEEAADLVISRTKATIEQSALTTAVFEGREQRPLKPLTRDTDSETVNIGFKLAHDQDMSCALQFIYAKTPNLGQSVTDLLEAEVVSVELGCNDYARTPHYRIKNNQ